MAKDIVLQTSMGNITLELYDQHAPKSCALFTQLVTRNFYDNTIFHRIIHNFMIQGGDPTGTGRGGGPHFEDELNPELKHTGAGILSLANAGPNTANGQFFITLAPTPWLDGKHTIFGRVKSGLRVVQRMGLVKTGGGDRPLEEVKILKAFVKEEEEEVEY
ncbi:peptidyl-prolyl cis-trans isomerase ppi1 [Ascobolus immersus RN42]|uniref:Peptidyl-prolyl cis-trans isomerase n=1 Tax=Ascobolus immersus RN42 TaxID=1160509 RepID=A0A3N4HZV0_ASCIM|nr:peptidyl-prolyl cis-trans isomerase ppi1 [Ascobolus immersus RN42]